MHDWQKADHQSIGIRRQRRLRPGRDTLCPRRGGRGAQRAVKRMVVLASDPEIEPLRELRER
jgi:hypothetical protein